MTVQFNLPAAIADALRKHFDDLNQASKEAALVELYRQSKITHHQLGQGLGLSRFEVDAILKKHNVTEDLLSVDEFLEQVEGPKRQGGK